MPNLVGIGNSQVPTNAMLGGLAYKDSIGEINLDKIKARTSDTAVDIFVYDTRKDSDGGAWRHRTQNTSWYNEGVSATRGARKEFPVVAVIVVSGGGAYDPVITIYDGDDSNLPMWMVFQSRNTGGGDDQTTSVKFFAAGPYPITSVTMLNGVMVDCQSRSPSHIANIVKGVTRYNFINDSSIMITDEGDFKRNGNLGDERNTERSYTKISTVNISHTQCNDVAMTVLPNAPIDASTGLPVPTIAVATDGGTNVINDDGTVTQGYQTIATENVDLHPAGYMTDGISGATNDNFSFYKIGTIARVTAYGHRIDIHPINTFVNQATGQCLFEGGSNKMAIAQSHGLVRIEEALFGYAIREGPPLVGGLHNKTTFSYNTGWMPAYAKGVFLSSTDDTNVTGELIDLTNGEAVTGAGQWGSPSANQIAALSTSDAVGRYNTGTDASVLVNGKQYLATLTISNYSGSGDLGVAAGAGFDGTFRYSANGTYYKYISYTSGEVQLFYRNTNTATIGISLKEVEEDRSLRDKGLAVHGTITKEPVATGAELVAYSGFTTTNHLEQPDKHLFGTGDFSFIFWVKLTAAGNNNQTFIDMSSSDGGVGDKRLRIHQMSSPSGSVRFYTTDGNVVSTSNRINAGWTCVAAVRKSSNLELYINGELEGSGSTSNSNFNTAAGQLSIGLDGDNTDPLNNGSITLIRSSASAPSPEQIKKIYNDEKKLFTPNAKCTLYGSSNAITALAYDDTTNVLHVGTSSGRSEFQGLNRINNTTTAVTTVISASNGFVAEQ